MHGTGYRLWAPVISLTGVGYTMAMFVSSALERRMLCLVLGVGVADYLSCSVDSRASTNFPHRRFYSAIQGLESLYYNLEDKPEKYTDQGNVICYGTIKPVDPGTFRDTSTIMSAVEGYVFLGFRTTHRCLCLPQNSDSQSHDEKVVVRYT